MTPAAIDRILQEYLSQPQPDSTSDAGLAAIRAAIFIEDVFDVTLPDELLMADPFARLPELRAFLLTSIGGG